VKLVYRRSTRSLLKRPKAESSGKKPERLQASSCREVIALLEQTPNRFVIRLVHRVTLAAGKRWGIQIAAGLNRDSALVMYASR
jgi:hypothetical protein